MSHPTTCFFRFPNTVHTLFHRSFPELIHHSSTSEASKGNLKLSRRYRSSTFYLLPNRGPVTAFIALRATQKKRRTSNVEL